ncbi:MAG: FAD binding domain-containing protein [Rhodobacteraceae bacterium]|nr:FAD binding domain-containing protein [Paracoccaceae bacterium]
MSQLQVDTFESIAEAERAMTGRSRYMGGGTLVMRAVNHGSGDFDHVVRTTDPRLRRIRSEGDMVELGAGVTMADILESPGLEFLAPAARSIGGPAVRNAASVGGNLFAPAPYGDFATVLLALDARVMFADGSRVPIDEFFRQRDSRRGLVDSLAFRRPGSREYRFTKVSRVRPKGVAVLSIAARLPLRLGRVTGARVAFGAMGPVPARAGGVETILEGERLDSSVISRAVDAVSRDLSPADDALASAWYRREVAGVHLGRLLRDGG